MLAIIREQLEMITGVSPSTHWLEDCLSALQIQNTDVEVASAAVLEQILHHDLRDVVRTFDEVSSSSSSCEAAAQSLRRAIEQSRMGETRRAVLPATFRLLVQVEELLDVSSNAEIRLAVGPSSTAPLGNQNARCLKVCYSDGFCTTGRSAYSENEEVQQKPLVAMELTPVPKMSANSLAGVKVLLTGPITIRHGIAGWHAGNAAVLGGCVPELVQIQKQALQLAKQRAGHGVDPTVKALIWNHQQQDGYEDEVDEGEGESGDVSTPRALRRPHQQQQAVPPSLSGQPPPSALPTYEQQRPASQLPLNVQQRSIIIPQNQQPRAKTTAINIQTEATVHHRASANPYAANSGSTMASASLALLPRPLNPYDNSRSHSPRPSSQLSLASNQHSMSTSSAAFNVVSVASTAANVVANPRQNVSSVGTASTSTLPSAASPVGITWSYMQLRDLLIRASNDEAVYRHAYGKIYCVQMKQIGPKLHFNIDKKPVKEKTKGDKQYEYVMIAKYGGESASDDVVTCKVSSVILEPHFSVAPGEMRKLNRQDKATSDVLVRDGGKAVYQCLHQLGSYELTLLRSPDEFFRSEDPKPPVDGDKPVLYLLSRR